MKKRRPLCVALALTLALTCCGCISSGDELLLPPRPALLYEKLESAVSALLASGYRYASPVSGEYRQAVQLIDLDGDGAEEAVVCLRGSGEKPLKIVFFTMQGTDYVQTAVIEGAGEAVQSVAFCDFNRDGHMEMVVGWKLGAARALSVYALDGGSAAELLSSAYSDYVLQDITGDGSPRLLIVQSDPSAMTGHVEMYTYGSELLELSCTVPLSANVEGVLRVRTGLLSDGRQGLFVASQYNKTGQVTDIFAYRGGKLTNVTLSGETGVSEQLVRYIDQAAADINNDGVLDLPRPQPLPPYDSADVSSDPANEIFWYSFDSLGSSTEVAHTYHSLTGNWYLLLPDAWRGKLTVGRRSSAAMREVIFACYTGADGTPYDIVTFYISAARPEGDLPAGAIILADRSDLFIHAVFSALPTAFSYMNLTESELRKRFFVIQSDWTVN